MMSFWKTGYHSHFYISFIPAYMKGFFLQLVHYFPVRVFFFLKNFIFDESKLFP